jgi:hypothetical protein
MIARLSTPLLLALATAGIALWALLLAPLAWG